jgi:hypothetical protein
LLLALILLAGGSLAAWQLSIQPLWHAWQSRDWPQAPVRIEAVDFVHHATGRRLFVRYRYRVNGQEYRAERYGLYPYAALQAAEENDYARLLYRRTARAWINPRHPEEAFLNRDVAWMPLATAIPAFGMILLGAVIFWAAGVAMREAWRQKRVI